MERERKELEPLYTQESIALYRIPSLSDDSTTSLLASTSETRAICNDPLLTGTRYTDALRRACAHTLRALANTNVISLTEHTSAVLHVLRGGLNFNLRDALSDAFQWSDHSSLFLSAQRVQQRATGAWLITESSYRKLELSGVRTVICGDVVATGTSLHYALGELARASHDQRNDLDTVLFFTIGGPNATTIVRDPACWQSHGVRTPRGIIVYFEGVFHMASPATPVRIKLDGTDLLRRDSILAPEFIESQYEAPSIPLERCTIYDAGSRAFHLSEYLSDVREYWEQLHHIAGQGVSYAELLRERAPSLDLDRFGEPNLREVTSRQLERIDTHMPTR